MKLLIDMNLSPKWVEFLDGAGFESTIGQLLALPIGGRQRRDKPNSWSSRAGPTGFTMR